VAGRAGDPLVVGRTGRAVVGLRTVWWVLRLRFAQDDRVLFHMREKGLGDAGAEGAGWVLGQ
jgi:hypothetical protein